MECRLVKWAWRAAPEMGSWVPLYGPVLIGGLVGVSSRRTVRPLLAHPRIVATAHTASLTSDYFAAASRRLGDALAAYFIHQPPTGLLSTP